MTTSVPTRTLLDVVIGEPLALAKAQPHQVLLSTGSVSIMAAFAATDNIVHPLVGLCIAVGVEWAYLRGQASDVQARSNWGAALNWSAFLIVVLWGVLWCGRAFGALAERPTGTAAWVLAIAHVLPIAWLSLCSAMCHRAAQKAERTHQEAEAAAERERQRRLQEQRDAIALEAERERERMARWQETQRFKAELKRLEDASTMPAPMPAVPVAAPKTTDCPTCRHKVAYTSASEAGTIRRWGCPSCRARKKEGAASS